MLRLNGNSDKKRPNRPVIEPVRGKPRGLERGKDANLVTKIMSK